MFNIKMVQDVGIDQRLAVIDRGLGLELICKFNSAPSGVEPVQLL